MTGTPVSARIAAASFEGELSPSGVASFRRMFSGDGAISRFNDWASQPTTKAVASALRDLALNGPLNIPETDYALQYGMSLGIQLSAQLLTDPSTIFPEMLRKPATNAPAPDATFDTDPENI